MHVVIRSLRIVCVKAKHSCDLKQNISQSDNLQRSRSIVRDRHFRCWVGDEVLTMPASRIATLL